MTAAPRQPMTLAAGSTARHKRRHATMTATCDNDSGMQQRWRHATTMATTVAMTVTTGQTAGGDDDAAGFNSYEPIMPTRSANPQTRATHQYPYPILSVTIPVSTGTGFTWVWVRALGIGWCEAVQDVMQATVECEMSYVGLQQSRTRQSRRVTAVRECGKVKVGNGVGWLQGIGNGHARFGMVQNFVWVTTAVGIVSGSNR
ncbi:hypothetical protein EDB86DRAFT_3240549 [Lactarius hatsudake]|nr:hypothetical protein EDB86DRAFT_3240549 [Lactarius hatsudake]